MSQQYSYVPPVYVSNSYQPIPLQPQTQPNYLPNQAATIQYQQPMYQNMSQIYQPSTYHQNQNLNQYSLYPPNPNNYPSNNNLNNNSKRNFTTFNQNNNNNNNPEPEPPTKRQRLSNINDDKSKPLSAHELIMSKMKANAHNNNPYSINEKVEVKEDDLPMWLPGTIQDIGNDWVLVHYDGFSADYDKKIYIDSKRYKIRSTGKLKPGPKPVPKPVVNAVKVQVKDEVNDLIELENIIQKIQGYIPDQSHDEIIDNIGMFLDNLVVDNIPDDKLVLLAELYCIYAISFSELGRYDDGIAASKKCIQIAPKFHKGYSTLAAIYRHTKQYSNSIAQYQNALKQNMSNKKREKVVEKYKNVLKELKLDKYNNNNNNNHGFSSDDDDMKMPDDPSKSAVHRKRLVSDSDSHSGSDDDDDDYKSDDDNESHSSDDDSDDSDGDLSLVVKVKPKINRTVRLNDISDINHASVSSIRKETKKKKGKNDLAYYYRFNLDGEQQRTGPWTKDEHAVFMKQVKKLGVNAKWGLFSMPIYGRVGYQCSNYWRKLIKNGDVKDPNYYFDDNKRDYKQYKQSDLPINSKDKDEVINYRRWSFMIVNDISGVFHPLPYTHPNAPDCIKNERDIDDDDGDDYDNDRRGRRDRGRRRGRGRRHNDDDGDDYKPRGRRGRRRKFSSDDNDGYKRRGRKGRRWNNNNDDYDDKQMKKEERWKAKQQRWKEKEERRANKQKEKEQRRLEKQNRKNKKNKDKWTGHYEYDSDGGRKKRKRGRGRGRRKRRWDDDNNDNDDNDDDNKNDDNSNNNCNNNDNNDNNDNKDNDDDKKIIKKEEEDDGEPPEEYTCPISSDIMVDPVMVRQSGWTYERNQIEEWITENGTEPQTRAQVSLDDLIPNRSLRDAIAAWKIKSGYIKDE